MEEIQDTSCDNICSVCETGGPDDDLLLCGGFCLRAFHPVCLDGAANIDKNSYWCCFDCVHGLQRCFKCKEYERSNRMIKCTHSECGHWFHSKCVDRMSSTSSTTATNMSSSTESGQAYVCPQHHCHQCNDQSKSKTSKSKCFQCPIAYCESCRPAAVHVLDDRKYFTCVKHVQDNASLPPIPIRFMTKLVTTRVRRRMRCPSKYKALVEKGFAIAQSNHKWLLVVFPNDSDYRSA